jgi:tape measure domain-containing protein
MATIATTLTIADRMTAPLRNITSALQCTVDALHSVNTATVKGFDTTAVNKAQRAINMCNNEINKMNSTVTTAGNSVQRSTAQMSSSFNNTKSSILSFLSVIGGMTIAKGLGSMISSRLSSAFSRIDTMDNYNRTMTAITGSSQMAKASLNSIRDSVTGTGYNLDTAAIAVQNFVTRGMNIGNATSEVTKWLDAVSFYGAGTDEQLSTVTDALGKMMSKGTVEMEQLDRLTDVGIGAVEIYAQATGQSASAVQNALSKGTISSQNFITTVSTAFEEGTNGVLKIAGAAQNASASYEATVNNMYVAITRGLQDAIVEIDAAVEKVFGKDIRTIISDFGKFAETTIGNLGTAAGNLIIMVGPTIQIVNGWIEKAINNIDSIIPVVAGVVGVVGVFKGSLILLNTVQAIHNGLIGIATAKAAMNAKATLFEAAATETAVGAQVGLNAAMLACPAVWVIGIILAAIAVITAFVTKFNGFKTETTTGLQNLAGSVFVVGAGIYNFVIGILNGIIQLLYMLLVKPVEDVMNWVYNVFTGGFNSMQDAFTNLLAKMLGGFVSFAQAFTRIWDDITGQNFTAKLDSAKSYLDRVGTNINYTKKFDFAPKGINRKSYKDAYGKGLAFANKMTSKLVVDTNNNDLADLLNKISNSTASAADSASSISDSVAATSENIEYLKDMAEEQIINRYTNSVNVEMINHNNISNDLDIDDVTEHLRSTIEQGLNSNAGGNH